MAADPRTVTVHHPDRGELTVTPEVAHALVEGSYGAWQMPATDPDDVMPEGATERKAWIGDDAARARAALDAETTRSKPRKTVTDHARSVLEEKS